MSTESPTTPPPPAETTTPGAAIKAAWQRFTRGELVSYRVMAILLILIVGVGVLWFMNFQGNVAGSRQWLDLELASTTEDLEKVISDYPGTAPAKVAEFHLARIRLAPEGIDKLVTGDPQERAKALAAIEQAKESLSKMAPELKDSPVLLAECYLGLAKAELALVGITQEGRIDTFRGDPREAAQYLEKLADVAKDSPWGEEAKKLAAELRAPGGATTQDIQRVQTDLYNMLRFPARPGGGMFGPGGGMPFGPGGGMPFGPGSSPFGPISGLPGGGPVAPLTPGHPPLTP